MGQKCEYVLPGDGMVCSHASACIPEKASGDFFIFMGC